MFHKTPADTRRGRLRTIVTLVSALALAASVYYLHWRESGRAPKFAALDAPEAARPQPRGLEAA